MATQLWPSIDPTSLYIREEYQHIKHTWNRESEAYISVNTIHRLNVGSILSQRRRRWANIAPTLGQCIVLNGQYLSQQKTFSQCWNNFGQRLRRWTSVDNVQICLSIWNRHKCLSYSSFRAERVNPTLDQRLLFAGMLIALQVEFLHYFAH